MGVITLPWALKLPGSLVDEPPVWLKTMLVKFQENTWKKNTQMKSQKSPPGNSWEFHLMTGGPKGPCPRVTKPNSRGAPLPPPKQGFFTNESLVLILLAECVLKPLCLFQGVHLGVCLWLLTMTKAPHDNVIPVWGSRHAPQETMETVKSLRASCCRGWRPKIYELDFFSMGVMGMFGWGNVTQENEEPATATTELSLGTYLMLGN